MAAHGKTGDDRPGDLPLKEKAVRITLWTVLALFLLIGASAAPVTLLVFIVLYGYKLYEFLYFRSDKFKKIRNRISTHVQDCNELNDHIEELKATQIGLDMSHKGHAERRDTSNWNYKRSEFNKDTNATNVYNCSRNVVAGAQREPLKYVCKYFGFKADEPTLEQFETMLNNFTAAESGKTSLIGEKTDILKSVAEDVPWAIRKFGKKLLDRKLGFKNVRLNDAYYPSFKFQYVSSGGNASTQTTVIMDLLNLNAMVEYLNERIKWKKSVAGQRALMTSALRKSILKRDGYQCRKCGVSLNDEPHLLLEVDHIVPVSKGGMTTEENLQTLCWRCNRTKGAKLGV